MNGFFVPKAKRTSTFSANSLNYVKVTYQTNDLYLLIDTGASISIIFQSSLIGNEFINKCGQVQINGISGSTYSLGSTNISIDLGQAQLCHEFHVMDDIGCGMHGVLGSDFLMKYKATIDYEKFLFNFVHNTERFTISLQSQYNDFITIPPRCEVLMSLSANLNDGDECVISSEEISEGVYTAGIITKQHRNQIPVRILNVNDRGIKIRNFRPNIQKLENFNLYSNDDESNSVERVDELLDLINTNSLSDEEKLCIHKICAKYSDVFFLKNDSFKTSKINKQKIQLQENATPSYSKQYRLPQSQKTEIHKQVNKMISDGIIEPSNSEWSSPLLLVPKKSDSNGNKKWRIVIDYRKLNKSIKNDRFPLPNIEEILDSLSGATYFTHLDLYQGYYQIELDESSRPYTAFTTDQGMWQMTRLPMGLSVSPNIFSRAMTIAMSGLNYQNCFVYLDDLIIFGNNLQNHNNNLIKILNRLRSLNLKLNPKKCEFLKKEICYLGHTISKDGILPNPEKISVVQNYPTPQNSNETKRFVAFANYYRKFIPNFAQIATPLNRLLKKGVTFEWTQDCEVAFEKLKHALINPPILDFPNFSNENTFTLKTDASSYAIGAVLCNKNDRPVAYASRALNKAEQNYCTIEKELLAVVWAVQKFRPYLYGRKFHIFTDHRPLVYLFSLTNPSSRLTKFRLKLEEYQFEIHYLKGKDNVASDALSRIILNSEELKEIRSKEYVNVTTRAQAREMTQCSSEESSEFSENIRLDHPGIVELLKPPKGSIAVQLVDYTKFLKIKNRLMKNLSDKENLALIDNVIFDKGTHTISIFQDIRSKLDLGRTLRNLIDVCTNNKIHEIVLMKTNEILPILKEILQMKEMLTEVGLKINVINKAQNIDDKETRKLIINDYHILPTGGHAGINRLFNNIRKKYFWPGMREDIMKFVKKCDDCQRHKYSNLTKQPLTITTTATAAMEKIYVDIVGPLPSDYNNNKYILTIQCEISKFVECYPLINKEAETVAKAFTENFILRFGCPKEVVSDQGTEFMSSVFKNTCKLLKINHLNSTAYHHETLGALENSHKNLGAYLRIYAAKDPLKWSSWVPFWSFAYNNTIHTETKYTPFELVFGKSSTFPSNLISEIEPLYNFNDYSAELKYRLQTACTEARNNLMKSKMKRKDDFDKNSKHVTFSSGEKVLVKNIMDSKLDPIFKGPYSVLRDEHPNVVVEIGNKLNKVHKNRLKRYED